MLIYRPHRGGFKQSMGEKKEFKDKDSMKRHIVTERGNTLEVEDIVIGESSISDSRNGWKDTRNICVEGPEGQYCIGMYATEY